MRIYRSTVAACPTYFTPLQVHCRELLQLGVTGWVGWMHANTISIQKMIAEYSSSVVVAGCSLEYTNSCLFHEADLIRTESTSRVLKKGILIEGNSTFYLGEKQFAAFKIYFRPVLIGDHNSAAAKSGSLLTNIQERFTQQERQEILPDRYIKQHLSIIESDGKLLGTHELPIQLHRHAMDFADQWAFMESAAYCAASREQMAIKDNAAEILIKGLSDPLKAYHLDLKKPYFLLDNGLVITRAYQRGNELYFVHRLTNAENGNLNAVAIEIFNL
jgi:hypothetical protein